MNSGNTSIHAVLPQAHEMIERFSDTLENLYLTCKMPDGISTFASDNAGHFKQWMLLQCARLYNPERRWDRIIITKREFTPLKDASNKIPIKKYRPAVWRKTEA